MIHNQTSYGNSNYDIVVTIVHVGLKERILAEGVCLSPQPRDAL